MVFVFGFIFSKVVIDCDEASKQQQCLKFVINLFDLFLLIYLLGQLFSKRVLVFLILKLVLRGLLLFVMKCEKERSNPILLLFWWSNLTHGYSFFNDHDSH